MQRLVPTKSDSEEADGRNDVIAVQVDEICEDDASQASSVTPSTPSAITAILAPSDKI